MIQYVHVQHTATGAHDMIPAASAPALEARGAVKIIDATPGPYHRFKPHVPLGTSASPKPTKKGRTIVPVDESATEQAATTAEEANQ